jgi:hypothetical protein
MLRRWRSTIALPLLLVIACSDSDARSSTDDLGTGADESGSSSVSGHDATAAESAGATSTSGIETESETGSPEPEPEPEPDPEWNCGAIDCDDASQTTALGQMKQIDGCSFELELEDPLAEDLADHLLDRLEAEAVGTRRSMTEVLANLNREGRAGLSASATQRLAGQGAVGFRWNTGDEQVSYWYPQGITGTSDKEDDERFAGRRLLVVSWYHKTEEQPTRGARITVADISNLQDVRYRHLLLVDPVDTDDGPSFGPAEYDSGSALHVGGIVWYGDYLYVADTSQGMRIYDLARIFQPTNTDDATGIGISNGRSDAHGYLYAVPRIGRWRLTDDSCRVRFSFIGLDRQADTPALVTGEYQGDHPNGRLVVWPLDPSTQRLEVRQGITKGIDAVVIGQTRAQGGVRVGDDFFVSSSSQEGSFGLLYKNRPGLQSTSVPWVYGAEDLYHERGEGLLWTPAEHPGTRDVVAVPVF